MKYAPLFISLLSGALYGHTFPPYNLHVLAWFSLAPLMVVMRLEPHLLRDRFLGADPQTSPIALLWRDTRLALGAGFVANVLIFSWIWRTFAAAGVEKTTTLTAWMALALVLSLYWVVFCPLYRFLPGRWWAPFVAGAAWVCLEHIRSALLTGFPWALLAHTQASDKPFIQFASLTGTAGISFLLVAFNSALAELSLPLIWRKVGVAKDRSVWRALLRTRLLSLGVVAVLLFIVRSWGAYRLSRSDERAPYKSIEVRVLQGNIDQYQKWDNRYEQFIRDRYGALAREAAASRPRLVVWPESAVPGWYPNERLYVDWIRELAAQTRAFHIIGAVTTQAGQDYNAAFLINPQGEIAAQYYKTHLVPFGEYVPFGGLLKRWVPYLGQLGVFNSGKSAKIFPIGDVRISPNICYEAIFPDLVRDSVQLGCHLIVNITNDGWYLNTGAPEQHYVANVFRAVENGRPIVRAANTGISALIDAYGRESVRTPLMVAGCYGGVLPLPDIKFQTVFLRFGSWFSYLCWMAVIACFVDRVRRRRAN